MLLIRALAETNKGLTRKELVKNSGICSGGDFSVKLEELIESGFVSEYAYYQNKKKLALYRLSDEYSKIYIKFVEKNKNGGEGTMQTLSASQS